MAYDMCDGNHQNHKCQANIQNDEQVNTIGYKPNLNGAKNSQSFQKQQAQVPPGFHNQNRGQPNFRSYQQPTLYQQRPQQVHSNFETFLYDYIKSNDETNKVQDSTQKNMKIQISQLTTLVSEKIQGLLPSNTEKSLKERLKAIDLRSAVQSTFVKMYLLISRPE
ncbi:hypothetical protein RND71_022797 [Anisodus tanguticus]|uniref:Uncharacterized protein n=1 Tax=Anisodus tanguticus TaxID=243964 RepID=A0AAE1V6F6_9SOLA|nr:hypothetical protein RND71_022797 [Anisodus tanguticus]